MKKVISWVLFILTVAIFLLDIYFAVMGTIEVKNQYERLEETGDGGMAYMATGAGILVVGVVLVSVIGAILSTISARIAQNRAMRMISFALILLFILVPFFSYGFYLCIV